MKPESFPLPDQDVPKTSPIPSPDQDTPETLSIFRRLKGLKESLAFMIALSVFAPNLAEAKKMMSEPPQKPESAEQVRARTAEHIKTIGERLKTRGPAGTITFSGGGRTEIRRLVSSDGTVTTVGYDNDGDPIWIYDEAGDAHVRYIDGDADGDLDRVVLNKTPGSPGLKSATNDLNTFGSMDSVARAASMSAELDPEDVIVYEVERTGEEITLRAVMFEDGGAVESGDDQAHDLADKMQEHFVERIAARAEASGQ